MVAGAVVAGDARPVQAEHDGLTVQADVVEGLVDGPGQERRVDGEDRAQAAHGHAGGGGDGVLLGDADVEATAGKPLIEGEQAGGVGHGGGDGHQLGALLALLDDGLGEGRGVRAGLHAADVVEVLDGVLLGGGVALALLGEHVDDHGAVQLGGVAQGPLDTFDVVAVEGAGVADAQLLEEGGRLPHLAHGGLGGVEAPGQALAGGQLVDRALEPLLLAQPGRVEPQAGQALAQPGDRGGVGPAVVVEDDDGVAAAVAEVVQALEGHPAGHGAVADHGDDPSTLAQRTLLGHGQAVGVGEDGRGVAVLDPVVLGLFPGRVAREAAGLAQLTELALAPGEDLVDVGLVAGVPQDDVLGRVEDPVQGDRQLDGAEVGAEVSAAGVVDGGDHELPDLLGEVRELLGGQALQVGR